MAAHTRSHGPHTSVHTPPTPIRTRRNFKVVFSENSHLYRLGKSLLELGMCVLKVMGSCMQVGGVWAGPLLKMMVDLISGRPTPTARSWKPAHVTTWLASCSSMQRGNGPGTGGGEGHPRPAAHGGGCLGSTEEPGSPARCFLGHLMLIQPLECLSVQLWRQPGLEVRTGCKRKGAPRPYPSEDRPFFNYSVRNGGQTIGRISGLQGMGRQTLGWGHV